MAKPPFELNAEQMEAMQRFQAERQAERARGKLGETTALEANRMGQLTPDQRRALISQASRFGIIGVVLWFALLGAIFYFAGRTLENNPVIGIVVLFGTLFFAVWLVGLITSIPMRARLNDPHIEQASGEIVWHRSRYMAAANGRWLQSIYSQALKPGLYTLYYLAGTPYLLSAEMTGTHESATPTTSPQNVDVAELSRALQQTNGFTPADLETNRAGRLSGRQARWLLRDVLSNLYGIALLLVIVGLIGIGLASKSKVDPTGLLPVAAILGLAFIMLFVPTFRDARDAFGGRVLSVDGPATRRIQSYHRGRTSYYYVVAGHSFLVSNPAYDALLEGVRYRVFYVPHSGELMSIEPM